MKFFEGRKLKIDILVTFLTLLLVAVVCEIFYSTNANKELVLRFEKDHYSKKISSMASNWLDSYFSQVELVVSVLAKNEPISADGVSFEFADFDSLFKTALQKTPFTLSFYIALKDGKYLQVRNTRGLSTFQNDSSIPLPSYATYAVRQITNLPDGSSTETWEYFGDGFSFITRESLNGAKYDPRERSWYANTEVNKRVTWSDAYIFKTSRLPGITVSSPVFNENGNEVLGVVAVDFALPDFKDLLKNVKSSEHSSVRLINSKNEVLASTRDDKDAEKCAAKNSENFSLPRVIDIDDEILQVAAKNLLGTNDNHVAYKIGDGGEYVASMRRLNSVPFSILVITPQSDFTSDFDKVRSKMLFLSLFVFLFSAAVVFWLSKRISAPISKLCESAGAIGRMELEDYPDPPSSNIIEIKELSNAMTVMKTSISAFSKYTPKSLVHEVLQSENKIGIGGMTKEVTLFFSDIEKFSTISEKLPAEYLIFHLSEYFDELTTNIMRHNGTIDKYIGDSIMAIWGAPKSDEDQVFNACEAALDCQKILKDLKQKWIPLGKPPLPTRIGLHTGTAIVGNIGSQDRMNFTAIGDSVDIASSLEGANKIYGTWILASEIVERKARDKILFRIVDRVLVDGCRNGVSIYEPICSLKDANDLYYKSMELCIKSREAFDLYQQEQFEDALKIYREILAAFPEKSKSIDLLITRCEKFIQCRPENWDGIFRL